MRTARRVALRCIVALIVLLGALAVAGVLVVRSGWFREKVRQTIIASVEDATGGKVELGSFRFDWRHLVASVTPFVLHGTEGPGEPPLVRAESITIGLRIISLLERRVDLAYLRVDRPEAHFIFYPNGNNNLPDPPHPTIFWADGLVDLAVLRYEVNNGTVEYDGRDVPLNIRGDDLHIQMTYDRKGPRYVGDLASKHVQVMSDVSAPVEFDGAATFAFEKSGVDIRHLQLLTPHSRIDLNGKLENFRALHGTFNTKAEFSGAETVSVFSLPLAPTGNLSFDGTVMLSFVSNFDYAVNGRVNVRGLGYRAGRLNIQDASIRGELRAIPDLVTLQNASATALGSAIAGQASLVRAKNFHFDGKVDGLTVREAANIATPRAIPWSGRMNGTLTADAVIGESLARAKAHAVITPGSDGTPIEGRIDLDYNQQMGALRLGSSYVATPSTRVDLDGTLGETVQVQARSTNLDDLLPAIAMASDNPPRVLPLRLAAAHDSVAAGEAVLDGTVSGPLDKPQFRGQVQFTNAGYDGHPFDRFSGTADVSGSSIAVRGLSLTRGSNPATTVDGQVEITARNGAFDDATIAGRLNVRNAQIGPLANEFQKELGTMPAVTGTVSGTASFAGTLRHPTVDASIQADTPAGFGEKFDRVHANVRYAGTLLTIAAGEADTGPGKILFQGSLQHREGDWNNGDVHFDVTAQNLGTARVVALSNLQPGLDAMLNGKASGDARLSAGALELSAINGDLAASAITFDREAVGDLAVNAQTRGNDLAVRATAHIQQSTIQGQGTWRLEGDDPGTATVRIPRISIAALRRIVSIGNSSQPLAEPPFEGFLEGGATIRVALAKPAAFEAEVKIDTLQFNPKTTQTLHLGVDTQDVVLKNAQPIVISVTNKEAKIQAARFVARDTNLEATGTVPFTSTGGADLAIRGTVNLIILQLFNADLLARGNATVQTTVRGSLKDPQVNGRMELKNASLYLNDLPNGLDNVNGVVLFDRNRGTIEKLTAETGGGTITLSGFTEFGTTLVYRMQATAQQVRVRYPEDVSVTATAQLALTGTSDASTISGSVILNRAAVNPRADLGKLLAQSARPAPAPDAPSDYLRGMRFDVRIESAPNFELETSLTRDVQAEVDLRLRGTPIRPVLLGSVSVNAGEVQVFGNRYTVNRGDIRFQNAVRIEPSFDVNLETKARGVIVNISVSGTSQKMNVNYSSDPPLQSREIIALLAVGRGPGQAGSPGDTQLSSDSSSFVEAGGGLLGQAVSEQLSSRLQRFFGASRVKIDPLLTGVENIPEARLTLEQQVSKDITLTYITNLNRTQEQIVQVEWDVSRQWSAVAVRDSNGLFGVDFTFRKRFK